MSRPHDPDHLAKALAKMPDAELDAIFTDRRLDQLLDALDGPVDTSSAAAAPFWTDFED